MLKIVKKMLKMLKVKLIYADKYTYISVFK